jgi:hypothetical protein
VYCGKSFVVDFFHNYLGLLEHVALSACQASGNSSELQLSAVVLGFLAAFLHRSCHTHRNLAISFVLPLVTSDRTLGTLQDWR